MSQYFQLLLNDSKTDANAKGFGAYTPLHIAAQMDSIDICKRLVSRDTKGILYGCHSLGSGAQRES